MDSEVIYFRVQGKDEQNIKRRVYDALNVLIALGILRKEGRKIVGEKKKRNAGTQVEEHTRYCEK